jgi:intracellular septation protein
MRTFVQAASLLVAGLTSTLLFLALLLATGRLPLAIAGGMALGVAQIGWELARGRRVEVMQWLSLALVLASGGSRF